MMKIVFLVKVFSTSFKAEVDLFKVSWVEEIMGQEDFIRKGIGKMLMDTFEEKSKFNFLCNGYLF